MSKVFVVQHQHMWDKESNRLVPKFDLSPAYEFGELEFLLSPSASPFSPEPIIEELHEKLSIYSDDDYILLIGNPCLIGFVVTIAADYNEGRVKLLQWSGKHRSYIEIQAELFNDSAPM